MHMGCTTCKGMAPGGVPLRGLLGKGMGELGLLGGPGDVLGFRIVTEPALFGAVCAPYDMVHLGVCSVRYDMADVSQRGVCAAVADAKCGVARSH
jgi:hypothetical protein